MIVVIKLGGSMAQGLWLKAWLTMLADAGRGQVVIVPGGGAYAEMVREQQCRWKFSDQHAHRMALLAMDQYAIQLQGIEPRLVLASEIARIQDELAHQKVALWLPSAMLLAATDIASNWGVTSDSLAAWLARTLRADRLVLVKSCAVPAGANLGELSRLEIIDRDFTKMTDGAAPKIEVVSADALTHMTEILTQTQSQKG